MTIALVNTNTMKPPVAPIGPAYIAQALAAAGMACEVVDLCFSQHPEAALRARLRASSANLIGLTLRNTDDCFMASRRSFIGDTRDLVEAVRGASDATVVLGGAGLSAMPEAVLWRTGADYAVVGDGEAALVAMAQALAEGDDPAAVPGVVSRTGEGWRREEPVWPDLSDSAPLSWDGVDVERYFREGGQIGLETKRGCPMLCTYCADPLSKGRSVRPRPYASVVREVELLLERGIDHLHLCDAEVNLPPDHLAGLCDAMVVAGLGERVRWFGYATPLGVDNALCNLMSSAGCVGLNFGVDHCDDAMLARLRRGYTLADIERAVLACKRAGIAVMCDLLLGAPGETLTGIAHTLDVMKRLDPLCVGVALGVRLYPGTPLTAEVLAQGPLEAHSGVRGLVDGNDDLALPVYFVEPGLGEAPERDVAEMIGEDPRFFFGGNVDPYADYNYNDNFPLMDAIAAGARGAYWHILANMRKGAAP